MSFIPDALPNVTKCQAKCSEPGLAWLPHACFHGFGLLLFCVHLLKLCSDLQSCSVLDLRDVELEKEPTADAETEEYEETEAVQMFLRRRSEDSQSQSDAG